MLGSDKGLWHIAQIAVNSGWSGCASLGGSLPATQARSSAAQSGFRSYTCNDAAGRRCPLPYLTAMRLPSRPAPMTLVLLAGMFAQTAAMAQSPARIEVSKLGPQVGEGVPDFTLRTRTAKFGRSSRSWGPKVQCSFFTVRPSGDLTARSNWSSCRAGSLNFARRL